MEKLKIHLQILGGLKFDLNTRKIQNWNSKLFVIDTLHKLSSLPNTESIDGWYYSDKQLQQIIGDTSAYKVVVAIINAPLENNFYGRRIGDNIYVLSLYETGHIVLKNDLGLEQFIIQNIYYVTAIYFKYKGKIPLSDTILTHQDIRGCLFDFNADKEDIVFSLGKVSICDACKSDFGSTFVPDNFVPILKRELKMIKKPCYFRIRDFIKRRPIFSLILAVLASFAVNIFSNYIYELFRSNDTNVQEKRVQTTNNKKDEGIIMQKDSLNHE